MSAPPQDLTLVADANQARASDPTASAWVSANAGTGKTEVLVKRVLRLLLAGSTPERILCLTYTKTAAAEMQNRLLQPLAQWATLPAPELRKALAALLGQEPEEGDLRAARRLFASALEAKGGLRIYTIHGFCERLLQRFPLEAEVAPHFTVLDEPGASLMRRAAFDKVVARAAEAKDSALGKALTQIITSAGEDYFRQVVDSVLAKRDELDRMFFYHNSSTRWAEAECAALKRLFGIAPDETEERLTAQLADVIDDSAISAALVTLAAHADTGDDRRLAGALRTARTLKGPARVAALKLAFCRADGGARARFCSKAMQQAAPELCAALTASQARFAELDARLAHLACAEASGAVLALADAIHGEYARAKRAEATLDYDDLILKASTLLAQAGAAAWVLYKIDGGIDHILVDEAQDTSPAQWGIIESLAEEFFAGQGASERLRTLFAVGDEKQSIYSFQGADPALFGAMGRAFARRAAAAGLAWHDVPLTLSFRSTVPILKAVDEVFAKRPAADGLTWADGAGAPAPILHYARRQGQAGLVELWEVETETAPPQALAFEPWNEPDAAARSVEELCMRIAATIRGWLDRGEPLRSEGRAIAPGDILILVRRRDPFTAPMIRALKRERVPVAGADRMRLTEQLAVEDLVALAQVLLMPEDDLSLAVVLKSPLFALDDAALFQLAFGRPASLWAQLKEKGLEDARCAEAASCLSAWLRRAGLVPPYEFFSELLSADGQLMRKRLLRRIGPEAAEAIDEFLDRALAYDRESAPSLQGFIHQLGAQDIEIKRDMEQARDEVRIMTVHGAKGLQAPIVFLPDTCMLPRRQGPSLYGLPRRNAPPDEVRHLVWAAGGQELRFMEDAKTELRAGEIQEYHRLLYVAMTRARDRLYVCGFEGRQSRPDGNWYDLVHDGLQGLLSEGEGHGGAPVHRMEVAQTEAAPMTPLGVTRPLTVPLPGWAASAAVPERTQAPLAPSRAGERLEVEQAPLGPGALSQDSRYARGRLVHSLLQHLPEVSAEAREAAAWAFVAARGTDLPAAMQDEVVAETLAILDEPSFAALFGPSSLAEVPIAAQIGEGGGTRELTGQIDRLVVLEDTLLVLDYKTNRPPPRTPTEVAPAYIAQLAAYRIALQKLFPGRTLRAALLWTDGPQLMEIPSPLLDAAERRMVQGSGSLDVVGVAT
jgi:ATP-dependent helicase/nuclease subunit A